MYIHLTLRRVSPICGADVPSGGSCDLESKSWSLLAIMDHKFRSL